MISLFRAWVGSLLLMLVAALTLPVELSTVLVAAICLGWTAFCGGIIGVHVVRLFTGSRGRGE